MVHQGQPIPEFLQGGGETGQLLRSIDWSSTPLGPVEHWPQSLKTCIRIILTSSQPMFVWWGDQLINLYNDPYRSILGGNTPQPSDNRPRWSGMNLGCSRVKGRTGYA